MSDARASRARSGRRGVFPGSFNPPTVAHLTIAEAAVVQFDLDVVVLTISRVALAKESAAAPSPSVRAEALRAVSDEVDWLEVAVTDHQLLADISHGYDVLVLGADKLTQIHDVAWYANAAERDAALARLPELAVAPRPPFPVPDELRLQVPDHLHPVSSTAVRDHGRHEWGIDAARRVLEDAASRGKT